MQAIGISDQGTKVQFHVDAGHINRRQRAFKQQYSITSKLLESVRYWWIIGVKYNSKQIDVIYINVAKILYSIVPSKLLFKLEYTKSVADSLIG